MKILIVEDEEALSDPLAYLLGREGFTPVVVDNGLQAVPTFEREGADLVLLDVMLPGQSGLEVCKQLRAVSSVPIIMLTAKDTELDKVLGLELGADDYVTKPYSSRELIARIRAVLRRRSGGDPEEDESRAPLTAKDTELDKVLGLELGADDYVTKPYSSRELIARIRAVLRRRSGGDPEEDESRAPLVAGPVRMDVQRHVVTVDGVEVSMPLKEFELLEILLRNAGRVMTRASLIEQVWGADYVGDTKTLDVHIKRLRSKIEPQASSPRYVVTVRGLGYKFEA